jgi:hypothetical protein
MNDPYGYPIIADKDKIVEPDLTKASIKTDEMAQPKSVFSSTNITLLLLGGLYILMCYIAGYHAYQEYAEDPITLKWMRIIVAVMFMPFYVGYILLKSFFVEFMKSHANSFDFSFFDYLLNIAFTR